MGSTLHIEGACGARHPVPLVPLGFHLLECTVLCSGPSLRAQPRVLLLLLLTQFVLTSLLEGATSLQGSSRGQLRLLASVYYFSLNSTGDCSPELWGVPSLALRRWWKSLLQACLCRDLFYTNVYHKKLHKATYGFHMEDPSVWQQDPVCQPHFRDPPALWSHGKFRFYQTRILLSTIQLWSVWSRNMRAASHVVINAKVGE